MTGTPQDLSNQWEKCRRMGKPLEVAIVVGTIPVVSYAVTQKVPPDVDALALAGGLQGAPVKLIKCKTVDLEVPATSEIVLEGIIPTQYMEEEGPYGESMGYIDPRTLSLMFELICVTHRNPSASPIRTSSRASSSASARPASSCRSWASARGNYNDALMQTLAQNGNGVAAYIDTLNEARKVLVEEASSTLFPIAKDVKIQIEFNPARVAEYRLDRLRDPHAAARGLQQRQGRCRRYRLRPHGDRDLRDHAGRRARSWSEDLRYGQPAAVPAAAAADAKSGEYRRSCKIRYKLPKEDTSRLIELGRDRGAGEAQHRPGVGRGSVLDGGGGVRSAPARRAASQELRLRRRASRWPNGAKGDDPFGYRAEFVNLVRLAKSARP